MKRTIAILSLVFVLTVAAFAQIAPAPQPKPEHLSMVQLNTLISTAKTPAEHLRIAQYYQAEAQDYLAQAKEHEQMVADYKANRACPMIKIGQAPSTTVSTTFRHSRTWPPRRRNWQHCTSGWLRKLPRS
jgi:hypothetical protein